MSCTTKIQLGTCVFLFLCADQDLLLIQAGVCSKPVAQLTLLSNCMICPFCKRSWIVFLLNF